MTDQPQIVINNETNAGGGIGGALGGVQSPFGLIWRVAMVAAVVAFLGLVVWPFINSTVLAALLGLWTDLKLNGSNVGAAILSSLGVLLFGDSWTAGKREAADANDLTTTDQWTTKGGRFLRRVSDARNAGRTAVAPLGLRPFLFLWGNRRRRF